MATRHTRLRPGAAPQDPHEAMQVACGTVESFSAADATQWQACAASCARSAAAGRPSVDCTIDSMPWPDLHEAVRRVVVAASRCSSSWAAPSLLLRSFSSRPESPAPLASLPGEAARRHAAAARRARRGADRRLLARPAARAPLWRSGRAGVLGARSIGRRAAAHVPALLSARLAAIGPRPGSAATASRQHSAAPALPRAAAAQHGRARRRGATGRFARARSLAGPRHAGAAQGARQQPRRRAAPHRGGIEPGLQARPRPMPGLPAAGERDALAALAGAMLARPRLALPLMRSGPLDAWTTRLPAAGLGATLALAPRAMGSSGCAPRRHRAARHSRRPAAPPSSRMRCSPRRRRARPPVHRARRLHPRTPGRIILCAGHHAADDRDSTGAASTRGAPRWSAAL
jgi:hypothetical protein